MSERAHQITKVRFNVGINNLFMLLLIIINRNKHNHTDFMKITGVNIKK